MKGPTYRAAAVVDDTPELQKLDTSGVQDFGSAVFVSGWKRIANAQRTHGGKDKPELRTTEAAM